MKRALKNSSHQVVSEADSGEKAIIEYGKCRPDIVTMDWDMPGIGGIEAAKGIIAIDPDAKIVFVTAHDCNDLLEIAGQSRFKYIINKPVTEANVLAVFEKILNDKTHNKNSMEDAKSQEVKNDTALEDAVSQKNDSLEERIQESDWGAEGEQDKEIKKGQAVIISHYSRLKCFKGTIEAIGRNTLTLKTEHGISVNNFFEHDSIVIGYKSKDKFFVCGYRILSMNTKDRTIDIRYNSCFDLSSRAASGRLPVSLCVDIKANSQSKKLTAVVKDLDINNMTISSGTELDTKYSLEFLMPLFENLANIKAAIIQKNNRPGYFDYDLKIMHTSLDNKQNAVKWYINALKEQYIKSIEELDNSTNQE